MILELATEIGLKPQRESSTKGGEYHCPCPACGGSNRFMIWPSLEKYWCRQCKKSGDCIQFCRDFMGLDYLSAYRKVGQEPKTRLHYTGTVKEVGFMPSDAQLPPKEWQQKSRNFVNECHENLMTNFEALALLKDRGISLNTSEKFELGWNQVTQFGQLCDWGLPIELDSKGEREKSVWLPKGIVIPTLHDGAVIKLKVRRSDWKQGQKLPKYAEVSGSGKRPSLFGNPTYSAILLVEAELDAILCQQIAGDLCSCLALGGVGKKPDAWAHRILQTCERILFCLDFDDPGKKAYKFWHSTYPNLVAHPVPRGKSPGDAWKEGVDLRKWIEYGMKN